MEKRITDFNLEGCAYEFTNAPAGPAYARTRVNR